LKTTNSKKTKATTNYNLKSKVHKYLCNVQTSTKIHTEQPKVIKVSKTLRQFVNEHCCREESIDKQDLVDMFEVVSADKNQNTIIH